ncbi:hypothetical protein YC2023_065382 [Brassica napus]
MQLRTRCLIDVLDRFTGLTRQQARGFGDMGDDGNGLRVQWSTIKQCQARNELWNTFFTHCKEEEREPNQFGIQKLWKLSYCGRPENGNRSRKLVRKKSDQLSNQATDLILLFCIFNLNVMMNTKEQKPKYAIFFLR